MATTLAGHPDRQYTNNTIDVDISHHSLDAITLFELG